MTDAPHQDPPVLPYLQHKAGQVMPDIDLQVVVKCIVFDFPTNPQNRQADFRLGIGAFAQQWVKPRFILSQSPQFH
jgi:hypothetical protein